MNSLLDFGKRVGTGLTGLLDGLVDPRYSRDTALEAEAGEEQTRIAQERARQASLAAMLEPGRKWYTMTAAGDAAGGQAYGQHILGAAGVAEELRKRREEQARRERLAKLISEAPNLTGGDGKPVYTEQQLGVLGALGADEQAKVLMQSAFPKLSASGVATAGNIVATKRGRNGNIVVVVQTGDPANPVSVVDTGVQTEAELPSEIRTRLALLQDPTLIDVNAQDKQAATEGTETGKANIAALSTLPQMIAGTQGHIEQLKSLREQMASLPTGPIQGAVLSKVSSDMQVALAAVQQESLMNIARLAEAGVRLNPITEKELNILFQTSPQLSNYADANVRIIDARIKQFERTLRRLQAQLDLLDEGNDITDYRPSASPAPAPAAAPAPGAPAPAAQPSRFPTLP